jgi:hypothetical protein
MRHVGISFAFEHRQIDKALDAGLASNRQRQHGLGQLVGDVRGQQEHCADAFQRRPYGIGIGKIAADRRHTGGKLCRLWRARQSTDFDVATLQMGEDLGTDGPCAAGDENGHFESSLRSCGETVRLEEEDRCFDNDP